MMYILSMKYQVYYVLNFFGISTGSMADSDSESHHHRHTTLVDIFAIARVQNFKFQYFGGFSEKGIFLWVWQFVETEL